MLKEISYFLFIVLCFPNCLVGVFTLFLSLLFLVTPITTALLLPIYYVGLCEISSGSMLLLLQEEQLMIA